MSDISTVVDLARRHPRAVAVTAYVVIAVVATWPVLPRIGTEMAGGGWRTLWSFWWWAESAARRTSPFFSDALRWPAGVSLWAEASNVPAAVAVLPLWLATPHIPEVALYNLVLFASYPIAGYTAYLLARELWGEELPAFLAGALFTFGAHHLAAAGGPLDAVSIEWIPLYFLGLVRTFRWHGVGPPLLGGVALALATATSPYHLLACAVGTIVLVVSWWRVDRGAVLAPAFLRRSALLAGTFLVLAGWMCAALAPRLGSGGRAGAVDLLAFLVPGWGAWRTGEPGAYVGYVAMALAVVAARRAKASRPWLAVAVVGCVLAVGSRLHVAGVAVTPAVLPFAWLARAVPGTAAAARFGSLVALGVAMAAGAALAELGRAHRRGALAAVGITAVALLESWPGAVPTSHWPAPRFLRDLAKDGERWAVLDATAPERRLWHQVLHRHPQLGIGDRHAGDASATGSAVLDALVAGHAAPAPTASSAFQVQQAVRMLQQLDVRFLIADDETLGAARALRLPRAFAGDGIVVYEVPPRTG